MATTKKNKPASKGPKRPRGGGGRLLALGLLAAALLAGAALFVFTRQPHTPQQPITLEIARGTSVIQMADQLADAGVVKHPWLFLAARGLRPRTALQAGEYRFEKPATPAEVFDRIARGDVVTFEVTIPEGANQWDIGDLLEEKKLVTRREFLAAAGQTDLVRDLAPGALTLEGFLFPATYRFPRHITARAVVSAMVKRFRQAWREAKPPEGANLLRAVTLASLVEKETGVPAERGLVASVFENRLSKRMRLECDPTVVYAALLEHRYRGKIHRSDLDREHPYNTYRVMGLPPGPIANPGLKSIEAALRPSATDYLYFVAQGHGSRGHNFSADLKAHNQAVAAYRRGLVQETANPRAARR
jgi:UPF0755 protein